MNKGTIQSILATNSMMIRNLEELQRVHREARKICFQIADPQNPDTEQAYKDGKEISNRLVSINRSLQKHRAIAVEMKKYIAQNYPRTSKPKSADRKVVNFMEKVRG